ncbi:hypothetical protein A0J57_03990 [Sphingobium sp. 22B]|nr:hypothetical protein AXW74_00540 [Sphingobium sp. AM]KYC33755.1 hypothetical protein A0J57_03990 [Sphingobium sp. 22B]OAP33493.1 hypothetical protein A8O16_03210 [Sphingobium sp. 20006FA]
MMQETLVRFVTAESGLEDRARRLHGPAPDRLALWAHLLELGTVAALLPEAHGGFGGTPADMAVVQAALAEGLLVEPVLACAVVAARLLQAAEGEQAAALLAGIASGDAIAILAHAEGFDAFAAPILAAEPDGAGGYVLSGVKPAVRHADVASHLLLSARLGDETALFVLPSAAEGLELASTRAIDAAGAADVILHSVRLGPEARLAFVGDALDAINDALLWGLAGLAVETAAIAAAANRETFAYLNVREQFDTKLANFQALQHKAADMAIAGEEAAAMAAHAIAVLGSGQDMAERSRCVLAASLACDAAGRTVGHGAVQLFGGMGVSDETIVSHHARRLAAIRAQIGTCEARAARLSTLEGNG